jgi:hypothetical protein
MNKYCITFAGVVGSSKTPIAHYLSTSFKLPILNNDAIRIEVTEDLRSFNRDEYDSRQEQRCRAVLNSGTPFIYDASVDRKWPTFKEWLDQAGYMYFIISLDLSYDFLLSLYKAKEYKEIDRLPELIKEHERFLNEQPNEMGLRISDSQFPDRLNMAHASISNWLEGKKLD